MMLNLLANIPGFNSPAAPGTTVAICGKNYSNAMIVLDEYHETRLVAIDRAKFIGAGNSAYGGDKTIIIKHGQSGTLSGSFIINSSGRDHNNYLICHCSQRTDGEFESDGQWKSHFASQVHQVSNVNIPSTATDMNNANVQSVKSDSNISKVGVNSDQEHNTNTNRSNASHSKPIVKTSYNNAGSVILSKNIMGEISKNSNVPTNITQSVTGDTEYYKGNGDIVQKR